MHPKSTVSALFLAGTLSLAPFPAALAQAMPPDDVMQAVQDAALGDPLPVDPAVTVGELANGLRYYVRENAEPANRAALRLVVDVGSIVEDDDQLGLAHFLEHMAFNGTENFEKQEIVSFMESIGMRLGPGVNASTSFDETVYQLTVPMDEPEHLETAFRILEDWAHRMTLAAEEIEQERGVVIEEWRSRQGAQARAQDEHTPVLFHDSKYAERLPIGTLESLQTFDPEALRRFYEDWYRPDLMAVVAVGDFDAARIETLIRRHFEDIPRPEEAPARGEYDVPDHERTLYSIVMDPEIPVASVSVYHKLEPETDRTHGEYRQRIVEMLHNRMLSLRFQEITRRPDAPFRGADSRKGRLVRTLSAYLLSAQAPEDGIERALAALVAESERVERFGFTAPELERAATEYLRELERLYANRDNRSSDQLAAEYARAFLLDEPIPGIAYEYAMFRRFVPEITLDETERAAREWLRDSNRVVLVTAPEKPSLTPPDEETLTGVFEDAAEAPLTPYAQAADEAVLLAELPDGAPVAASRDKPGGITEWELGNGVRVVLKPTDFDDDEVQMHAFSPGGTSLAAEEHVVPARMAADAVEAGGLGDLDRNELERVTAGELAGANPFIAEREEGLFGSASPQDLETLFKLVYLRFTAPRADADAFEAYLDRQRVRLENRDSDPGTRFRDAFSRIMNDDHPRRRPMTVEMLDEANLEQSLTFYRERFADAGDFTFIFVGAFEPETLRPLVERYLGALPATGRNERPRDLDVELPDGAVEETVYAGLEPRSRTRIAFPPATPANLDDAAERIRLMASTQLLQARLRDVIREELGGTYSVGVGLISQFQDERVLVPVIEFTSDPERADELVQTVFAELASLRRDGPAEGRVADTRETMLRSHETNLEQNGYWRSSLTESYQHDAEPGAGRILTYAPTVEALTVDTLQQTFARYFDVDDYVHVTLMPESARTAQR